MAAHTKFFHWFPAVFILLLASYLIWHRFLKKRMPWLSGPTMSPQELEEIRISRKLRYKQRNLGRLQNVFGSVRTRRDLYVQNGNILKKARDNLSRLIHPYSKPAHDFDEANSSVKIQPTPRDYAGLEIYGDAWHTPIGTGETIPLRNLFDNIYTEKHGAVHENDIRIV